MKQSTISHFNNGPLLQESVHYYLHALEISEGNGTAEVTLVYPGIEIAKVDISAYQYLPGIKKSEKKIEINYCIAGRFECKMNDGCLQYVGEGDIFLSPLQNHCDSIELPLGYYQGFVITIDMDQAPTLWGQILPGLPDRLSDSLERFFHYDDCFMIHSREQIKHIFSSMDSAPEQVKAAFYRLKIIELLLFLHYFDPVNEKQKRIYTRQQVDIVKQIQKRITKQLSERLTIEALSQEYCISTTALKTYFKDVYGQSIAAYRKEYRMHRAASFLRETDKTILEIASSIGYESQSKFASAFKELMKITPMEYRKNHR